MQGTANYLCTAPKERRGCCRRGRERSRGGAFPAASDRATGLCSPTDPTAAAGSGTGALLTSGRSADPAGRVRGAARARKRGAGGEGGTPPALAGSRLLRVRRGVPAPPLSRESGRGGRELPPERSSPNAPRTRTHTARRPPASPAPCAPHRSSVRRREEFLLAAIFSSKRCSGRGEEAGRERRGSRPRRRPTRGTEPAFAEAINFGVQDTTDVG